MKLGHERELEQLREQHEKDKFQLVCDHKHDLLKLRTQLERLDGKNSSLKDKLTQCQKV